MLCIAINEVYACVDLKELGKVQRDFQIPLHLILWILNFLSTYVLVIGSDWVEGHGSSPQDSFLNSNLYNLHAIDAFRVIEHTYFSMLGEKIFP